MVHEYRAILDATTKFPSAGEHNVPVEEFVDLCVAVWEAGGAVGDQAAWVIDVRLQLLIMVDSSHISSGLVVGYAAYVQLTSNPPAYVPPAARLRRQ